MIVSKVSAILSTAVMESSPEVEASSWRENGGPSANDRKGRLPARLLLR